ncbi:uncharacterized protein LOC118404817 isoform X3 [Branchiostoma floridae]|uniref:Uncharacterized protein LOC118404817 isoform X3 n=1 Tax=Branchiostoma floridae TaxID=7739 RepID=A0A9J7HI45_BRAFL|nr:uncharacterized protein LOC118404817 isoform X3 [Branchiostoma floridae]
MAGLGGKCAQPGFQLSQAEEGDYHSATEMQQALTDFWRPLHILKGRKSPTWRVETSDVKDTADQPGFQLSCAEEGDYHIATEVQQAPTERWSQQAEHSQHILQFFAASTLDDSRHGAHGFGYFREACTFLVTSI